MMGAVLAFNHLVERDYDYATGLNPSGVLLSGPLPGVIAYSDSQVEIRGLDGGPLTPHWTSERVGGADLLTEESCILFFHGHDFQHEMYVSTLPLRATTSSRQMPRWFRLYDLEPFFFVAQAPKHLNTSDNRCSKFGRRP